jgi:hypothetical protein
MRSLSLPGRLAFVLVSLVAVAGCSAGAPQAVPYSSVSPESLASSDPIPSPTGEVVLTVTGDVSKTNDADGVALDFATIERMGLVKYGVHDPWLDADHEFTGVLLADLLDTVGAAADATTVHVTALDDYEVQIAVADVRRWPILLATMTDGARMPIIDKGPTRIVFPYAAYPEIDELKYKDLWIWQIKTIEVR